MVPASIPDHMSTRNMPKSHFQQTVCLVDWWLKFENDLQGRRLAVAGFTSLKKQAMRLISSAPILKRYDAFTLETTDGICVILEGLMNKVRTAENGFSSDVYNNHFVFGFPPYWKEFDENFMGKEFLSDIAVEDGQPHVDNCRNRNFEVSGLHAPAEETELSELDVGSVRDEFEQIPETLHQVKDLRKVKSKGNMPKAKEKSTRTRADYQKGNGTVDRISLSEKAKQSEIKTRRKLAYETPVKEKEKGSSASPQSLSFNRSRSGRLLMPTLEFWRNQRATYNADGTVTGIVEDRDPEQPRKESGSTARRKRRQPI